MMPIVPNREPHPSERVSVVIPLHNEEDNVEPLCQELLAVLDGLARGTELVLVDDGSGDATFPRAAALAHADARIRVVRLARNCGQTAALQAGLDHARGEILVLMDGDRQNDPADIPRLLAAIDEGYQIVTGWRQARRDRWLSRRLPSALANALLRLGTGIPIHDSGCALKAYRRGVAEPAPLYADMHRFLPVLMAVEGAPLKEVPVYHRARVAGKSKYGLGRAWTVLLDVVSLSMLARFTTRPGRGFLLLALPFLIATFAGLIGAVLQYQHAASPETLPVVYPAVVMLSASACLHLVLLAVLSELVQWTGDRSGRPRAAVLERGEGAP